MNDSSKGRSRVARWGAGAALLVAGGVAGGVLAGTLSANAASSSGAADGTQANCPPPGTAAHENQEKAVTGADATKAQAAAVKAVGGGKAGAVTTDFIGKGYEVTVTKSDGSKVEVHLDSAFTVMPPGPMGGPMGGPPGRPPVGPSGRPPVGPPSGSSRGFRPSAG